MIKTYTAPDGAKIIGTLETLKAVATIEGIDSTTGEAIYTGDTNVDWNSMRTVLKGRRTIFVDDLGRRWEFARLVPVASDHNVSSVG